MDNETQTAKKWYKSKTMKTNIAAIFGAVVGVWFGEITLAVAIPTILMGVANIILRWITGTPIEKKVKP